MAKMNLLKRKKKFWRNQQNSTHIIHIDTEKWIHKSRPRKSKDYRGVCVCVCAVSYTHLDVYKRQVERSA